MQNHRIFFVTTHFAKAVLPLQEQEYGQVLRATDEVRRARSFLLFAYVVMPTHFHLLLAPADADSLSNVMREIKLRAARSILAARKNPGPFWQARFFDRILRNRNEWSKTLEYIHWNPVQDGLIRKPADWKWSSWPAWIGVGVPPIGVDVIDVPIEGKVRLAW